MNNIVQYPSAALSPYIKLYWGMDGFVEQDTEHIQRIIPTGLADLIFYFNDLPENIIRDHSPKSRSVINGQQTEYFDLKVKGRINLFSVTFTPQGTKLFFNIPINEIYNKNLPLNFIIGSMAGEIEEKLFHAIGFNDRVKIIEKYLIKNLGNKNQYEFNRMDSTIRMISGSRANTTLDQLSNNACLSRKQFERSFSGNIGLTPKQFLRIIRFQNAIDIKSKFSGVSLTEIAYRSGYSDQSHMIREFRRISGLTPGKYFSSCDAISDYFI